jgi:uncharacterized protein YidB (DUF937 family)
MARSGFPSMTALLGLLAVAGYRNRDKLSELLRNRSEGGLGGDPTAKGADRQGGLEGVIGSLAGGTGTSAGLASILSGGLGELTERFRQNGHGDAVDSWVRAGPNRNVAPRDLEEAIGPDVLDDLTRHTGLSREELLARLSRDLPDAVDQYTPHGRLPSEDEVGG